MIRDVHSLGHGLAVARGTGRFSSSLWPGSLDTAMKTYGKIGVVDPKPSEISDSYGKSMKIL